MGDDGPADVFKHYGSKIPEGVGEAARLYNTESSDGYPKVVAELKRSDDVRVSEYPRYEFVIVAGTKDGAVVRKWTDYGDCDGFWALEEEIIPTCVARLVSATSLVVVDGEDEYLPPLVADSMEEAAEFFMG